VYPFKPKREYKVTDVDRFRWTKAWQRKRKQINKRKKTIMVNVIKTRMLQEQRASEDIIKEYIKLTEEEKTEILADIK
jgi:hypothetical protein